MKNNYTLKCIRKFLIIGFLFVYGFLNGQDVPTNFQNPVLPGFGPDPSICRVDDDYYLVTSSFAWFPGIPIYHSKDLVNWKLIGHGITRAEQMDFNGLRDKQGIWAPTIRYHDGLFYIITTYTDKCSSDGCGDNFYITAENPSGEWSGPVWLKGAKGIDPSLFWDDDGTCYYTGNNWGIQKSWSGQCAIWAKELDLEQQKLLGEMKVLTFGHANNARNTEAAHIYKIDGKYMLVVAEGGTNEIHAVSVHHSSSVFGPYIADRINPVLTHRHFGQDYPIQAVGHADLVQTQHGDWWAVVLGKRLVDGHIPLSRETFLCKVDMENGTPIFNAGHGKVLMEQERPNLPWTPVIPEPFRDEFETDRLALKWHTVRGPREEFYNIENGRLSMKLRPQVVDDLVNSSILIQSTMHFKFSTTTKLSFKTSSENEQAGLILYRVNDSYYMLMKEKGRVVLIKKFEGNKTIVAEAPYNKTDVFFNVETNKLDIQFRYGESLDGLKNIGEVQSLVVISESQINKFNGTGIGMYATSKGQKSKNKAIFDWFEYKY